MEISQRLGIRREYALPQGKYDVLNGKEKSRGGVTYLFNWRVVDSPVEEIGIDLGCFV